MTLPFVIRNSSFGISPERLTTATLAKAFRGELVPQDPGDEPASDLLKRIRAASGTKPTPESPRTASKLA